MYLWQRLEDPSYAEGYWDGRKARGMLCKHWEPFPFLKYCQGRADGEADRMNHYMRCQAAGEIRKWMIPDHFGNLM